MLCLGLASAAPRLSPSGSRARQPRYTTREPEPLPREPPHPTGRPPPQHGPTATGRGGTGRLHGGAHHPLSPGRNLRPRPAAILHPTHPYPRVRSLLLHPAVARAGAQYRCRRQQYAAEVPVSPNSRICLQGSNSQRRPHSRICRVRPPRNLRRHHSQALQRVPPRRVVKEEPARTRKRLHVR